MNAAAEGPRRSGEVDRAPPAAVVAWELGGPVDRTDAPALCATLAALLRESPAAVVVCDVGAITEPDIGTLDVLARLQLTAHRLSAGIRLSRAHARLRHLLQLTGLAAVLPLAAEPGRQVEQREQAGGVEEGVEPADPAG